MSANAAASEKVTLDLHDLYENAPCGYHSVGPDGTILRMNRTQLTWLGYSFQELVGKRKFAELVAARHYGDYQRAFESCGTPKGVGELETELVRKDGSHIGEHQPIDPIGKLSNRERQILQLVAEGKSTADIASTLFLSPKTVDTYRSRLMRDTETIRFCRLFVPAITRANSELHTA